MHPEHASNVSHVQMGGGTFYVIGPVRDELHGRDLVCLLYSIPVILFQRGGYDLHELQGQVLCQVHSEMINKFQIKFLLVKYICMIF